MQASQLAFARLDARSGTGRAREQAPALPAEFGNRERGVGEDLYLRVQAPLVVGRPARDLDVRKTYLHPSRCFRHQAYSFVRHAVHARGDFFPVARVECDNEIGVLQSGFCTKAHVERVAIGKVEPGADVDDARADEFGQRHQVGEAMRGSAGPVGEQDRVARRREHLGDAREFGGVGRHAAGHARRARWRQGDSVRQGLLEHGRVIAGVHRALRLGHHRAVGAGERIGHIVDGVRLIIPLGVVAYGVALYLGGVNPVGARTPLRGVHGTGRANDENRRTIDVGVIDRHAGVQQPDQVVNNGNQRLARRLGVAVRDLDGDVLVRTQEHLRVVLPVIDHRVMQAAIARTRVERHIRKIVLAHQVNDDVRTPADLCRNDFLAPPHGCTQGCLVDHLCLPVMRENSSLRANFRVFPFRPWPDRRNGDYAGRGCFAIVYLVFVKNLFPSLTRYGPMRAKIMRPKRTIEIVLSKKTV